VTDDLANTRQKAEAFKPRIPEVKNRRPVRRRIGRKDNRPRGEASLTQSLGAIPTKKIKTKEKGRRFFRARLASCDHGEDPTKTMKEGDCKSSEVKIPKKSNGGGGEWALSLDPKQPPKKQEAVPGRDKISWRRKERSHPGSSYQK